MNKHLQILIGTPIHQCKDYAMEKWLKNVSKLTYPADFLMVDNSPGLLYVEKVKGYCAKYGIKNYKIEHLETNQALTTDMRIEVSQEMIRQYVLSRNYDAWFSWECDQIIPVNALGELIRIMKVGDFMIVAHNSWRREFPTNYSTDMGVTLIKKEALEKYEFIRKDSSGCWQEEEDWFNNRVLRGGGNCVDVFGVIGPIYHLNK